MLVLGLLADVGVAAAPTWPAPQHTYSLSAGGAVGQLVAGTGTAAWFTDTGRGAIGEFSGRPGHRRIREFSAGIPAHTLLDGLAVGKDGNVWFTERFYSLQGVGIYYTGGGIARLNPSGKVTQFTAGISGLPDKIVLGPDGNVYFTERPVGGPSIGGEGWIARITPLGAVTEFRSSFTPADAPDHLTVGPGNSIWFSYAYVNTTTGQLPGGIGRMSLSGQVTTFTAGIGGPTPDIRGITAGPDGNIWFVEYKRSRLARITPSGRVTEYLLPSGWSLPTSIIRGPTKIMFMTLIQNGVAVVTISHRKPRVGQVMALSGANTVAVELSQGQRLTNQGNQDILANGSYAKNGFAEDVSSGHRLINEANRDIRQG